MTTFKFMARIILGSFVFAITLGCASSSVVASQDSEVLNRNKGLVVQMPVQQINLPPPPMASDFKKSKKPLPPPPVVATQNTLPPPPAAF